MILKFVGFSYFQQRYNGSNFIFLALDPEVFSSI